MCDDSFDDDPVFLDSKLDEIDEEFQLLYGEFNTLVREYHSERDGTHQKGVIKEKMDAKAATIKEKISSLTQQVQKLEKYPQFALDAESSIPEGTMPCFEEEEAFWSVGNHSDLMALQAERQRSSPQTSKNIESESMLEKFDQTSCLVDDMVKRDTPQISNDNTARMITYPHSQQEHDTSVTLTSLVAEVLAGVVNTVSSNTVIETKGSGPRIKSLGCEINLQDQDFSGGVSARLSAVPNEMKHGPGLINIIDEIMVGIVSAVLQNVEQYFRIEHLRPEQQQLAMQHRGPTMVTEGEIISNFVAVTLAAMVNNVAMDVAHMHLQPDFQESHKSLQVSHKSSPFLEEKNISLTGEHPFQVSDVPEMGTRSSHCIPSKIEAGEVRNTSEDTSMASIMSRIVQDVSLHVAALDEDRLKCLSPSNTQHTHVGGSCSFHVSKPAEADSKMPEPAVVSAVSDTIAGLISRVSELVAAMLSPDVDMRVTHDSDETILSNVLIDSLDPSSAVLHQSTASFCGVNETHDECQRTTSGHGPVIVLEMHKDAQQENYPGNVMNASDGDDKLNLLLIATDVVQSLLVDMVGQVSQNVVRVTHSLQSQPVKTRVDNVDFSFDAFRADDEVLFAVNEAVSLMVDKVSWNVVDALNGVPESKFLPDELQYSECTAVHVPGKVAGQLGIELNLDGSEAASLTDPLEDALPLTKEVRTCSCTNEDRGLIHHSDRYTTDLSAKFASAACTSSSIESGLIPALGSETFMDQILKLYSEASQLLSSIAILNTSEEPEAQGSLLNEVLPSEREENEVNSWVALEIRPPNADIEMRLKLAAKFQEESVCEESNSDKLELQKGAALENVLHASVLNDSDQCAISPEFSLTGSSEFCSPVVRDHEKVTGPLKVKVAPAILDWPSDVFKTNFMWSTFEYEIPHQEYSPSTRTPTNCGKRGILRKAAEDSFAFLRGAETSWDESGVDHALSLYHQGIMATSGISNHHTATDNRVLTSTDLSMGNPDCECFQDILHGQDRNFSTGSVATIQAYDKKKNHQSDQCQISLFPTPENPEEIPESATKFDIIDIHHPKPEANANGVAMAILVPDQAFHQQPGKEWAQSDLRPIDTSQPEANCEELNTEALSGGALHHFDIADEDDLSPFINSGRPIDTHDVHDESQALERKQNKHRQSESNPSDSTIAGASDEYRMLSDSRMLPDSNRNIDIEVVAANQAKADGNSEMQKCFGIEHDAVQKDSCKDTSESNMNLNFFGDDLATSKVLFAQGSMSFTSQSSHAHSNESEIDDTGNVDYRNEVIGIDNRIDHTSGVTEGFSTLPVSRDYDDSIISGTLFEDAKVLMQSITSDNEKDDVLSGECGDGKNISSAPDPPIFFESEFTNLVVTDKQMTAIMNTSEILVVDRVIPDNLNSSEILGVDRVIPDNLNSSDILVVDRVIPDNLNSYESQPHGDSSNIQQENANKGMELTPEAEGFRISEASYSQVGTNHSAITQQIANIPINQESIHRLDKTLSIDDLHKREFDGSPSNIHSEEAVEPQSNSISPLNLSSPARSHCVVKDIKLAELISAFFHFSCDMSRNYEEISHLSYVSLSQQLLGLRAFLDLLYFLQVLPNQISTRCANESFCHCCRQKGSLSDNGPTLTWKEFKRSLLRIANIKGWKRIGGIHVKSIQCDAEETDVNLFSRIQQPDLSQCGLRLTAFLQFMDTFASESLFYDLKASSDCQKAKFLGVPKERPTIQLTDFIRYLKILGVFPLLISRRGVHEVLQDIMDNSQLDVEVHAKDLSQVREMNSAVFIEAMRKVCLRSNGGPEGALRTAILSQSPSSPSHGLQDDSEHKPRNSIHITIPNGHMEKILVRPSSSKSETGRPGTNRRYPEVFVPCPPWKPSGMSDVRRCAETPLSSSVYPLPVSFLSPSSKRRLKTKLLNATIDFSKSITGLSPDLAWSPRVPGIDDCIFPYDSLQTNRNESKIPHSPSSAISHQLQCHEPIFFENTGDRSRRSISSMGISPRSKHILHRSTGQHAEPNAISRKTIDSFEFQNAVELTPVKTVIQLRQLHNDYEYAGIIGSEQTPPSKQSTWDSRPVGTLHDAAQEEYARVRNAGRSAQKRIVSRNNSMAQIHERGSWYLSSPQFNVMNSAGSESEILRDIENSSIYVGGTLLASVKSPPRRHVQQ